MANSLWTDIAPNGAATALDLPAATEGVLAEFLSAQSAAMAAMNPDLGALAGFTVDAVLGGGKRIRPTFAYWGWRGLAGPDEPVDGVLPAFAALELLHAFALVHDDVMDASATRRGRPTIHRAFADLHRARRMPGDAHRFGQSSAILVGDLCLVWADRLIATAAVPGATVAAARAVYDRMRVEAIAGQYLDILGESTPDWSVEQALCTARLKTASYTVTQPLLYGAALSAAVDTARAGRSAEVLTAYSHYGLAVGVAFQLRDDLLGLYGEPSLTGKPLGDDVSAAKPTVPLQLARSMATGRQRAQLERALRRGGRNDMARVAALVTEVGARHRVENMIAERVELAGAVMATAPVDAPVRAALCDLAGAAAWRSA
ncbi:MAG TPA: polyprenyl synthetase family protein [Micromonosporaceae bacterium]|jgi:geranylgeranyl diphosphate synthase type I